MIIVTRTSDGSVVFETGTVAEAVELAKALTNGVVTPPKKRSVKPPEQRPLPPAQLQAWEWLVANDLPAGRTVGEIAEALNINVPAANDRLIKLNKAGVARKIGRGVWRAGEQ